jgi:hypothetical protein
MRIAGAFGATPTGARMILSIPQPFPRAIRWIRAMSSPNPPVMVYHIPGLTKGGLVPGIDFARDLVATLCLPLFHKAIEAIQRFVANHDVREYL